MKKNLTENVPCCCASDPGKAVRKLGLPDGLQVGIVNLDNILEEVAALNFADAETIKAELLERVAKENYVPSCAASEYSTALFKEYKQIFFKPVED